MIVLIVSNNNERFVLLATTFKKNSFQNLCFESDYKKGSYTFILNVNNLTGEFSGIIYSLGLPCLMHQSTGLLVTALPAFPFSPSGFHFKQIYQ